MTKTGKRHRLYTSGKLPSHRLFYATGATVAGALGTPAGISKLVKEIDALTGDELLLRTDALERRYNLPRTNTVNGAQAINWLRRQLEDWRGRSISMNDIAFIMHSYIPARASAWSYHRRGSPTVRIDALWGLADGMQYYPTDTYICRSDSGKLISETLRYKELVLLEQLDGQWVTDHIAPRFARHRVLTNSERIDISTRTREISENLSADVQIMWFVDIPTAFSQDHSLPWFKITPEQDVDERRSQLLKSITIRKVDDLGLLDRIEPGSTKIVLEPSGEDLRSDTFINAVGTACVALNLPVEIRGSILSHAYHQLANAGVQVFSAEPGKSAIEMRQRRAFDKLVRDQVPASIAAKGESVSSVEIDPRELSLAIVGKIFEEAEEFLNAESSESMTEELADIFELLRGLSESVGIPLERVISKADTKRAKRGGFDRGVILRATSAVAAVEPENANLFQDEEIARRITVSALADAHASRRRDVPITALLMGEPRTVRVGLTGGLEALIRLEVASGIISISGLELLDEEESKQRPLDLT